MRATRRLQMLGLGALVLLGAALRGEALPPKAVAETWTTVGTHSTRGGYKASLVITSTDKGELQLAETLTFVSDKSTLSWQGTGELKNGTIEFKVVTGVGVVLALDGTKKKPKTLHGTYTVSDDGKSVFGLWNDDRDGTFARERGTRVASSGGLLVLVDGDGKDVSKEKKERDGVVLAADLRETESAPRRMLKARLERPAAVDSSARWVVDFPAAKLAVFADEGATQPIKPGEPFAGTGAKTTLFLEGLVPSEIGASETLRARLEKDGWVADHDRGKVTVAQSAFMVCGHGHSSTYRLRSWLGTRMLDHRVDPTIVMGKTDKGQPVPWAVFIFESRAGAALALSTPGAVVSYDGHSNFGLGFAFDTNYKKLHDFMLISDPQVAINWDYLREHQGHPELMIEESEYGDDASTPEFSDPVAVRRGIKGAHGDYDNMRTVRFPLSGGDGTRCTLRRGTERWNDTHGAIDGTRLVLKSGSPDMPAKRWSKLMLNSCYSGPYYYESFGGRGTMFFTLEESSSPATTAQFIEGCIDGKANDDILKTVNGEENIWDFHVFGE